MANIKWEVIAIYLILLSKLKRLSLNGARARKISGVNKKPFACPFQDSQFQNPNRL